MGLLEQPNRVITAHVHLESTQDKDIMNDRFKLLSLVFLLVSLTVLFCGISDGSDADKVEVTVDGINYEVENGEACVVQGDYSGTVTIPSSIDVDLPGVTEDIPVTSILNGFYDCAELTTVNIPSSIDHIVCAFAYCPSLSAINVDENNEKYMSVNGVLFDKETITLMRYPEGKTDASYTIPDLTMNNNGSGAGSTTVHVRQLGGGCFRSNIYLTSVTLPSDLVSIDMYAFIKCSSLQSISIPANVTSITDNPFLDCTSLTSINVSTENTHYRSIDGVMFSNDCRTIIAYPNGKTDTSYIIPNNVETIGDSCFEYSSKLTSITIPNSVTTIGNMAFRSCSSIETLNIPDSVTSIGYSVFSGCSSMTFIDLSTGITSLPSSAFSYCSSLVSLYIPRSVTSIDGDIFYSCTSLETVVIPGSITSSINDYLFLFCTSLREIIIESNDAWGTDISCSFNISFYSEDGTTSISSSSTDFDGYAYIKDDSSKFIRHSFSDVGKDGLRYVLAILDDDILTLYGNGEMIDYYNKSTRPWHDSIDHISEVIIKEGVKSIGVYAFYECTSLKNITLPDSITSIAFQAFAECTSLTSVTIGNGVELIISDTFQNCTSLTNVTLGCNVTFIGDRAFGSYSLVEICNNSALTITKGSTDNGGIAQYALNVYSSNIGSSKLHYQTLDDSSVAVYYQDDSVTHLVKIYDMKSTVILPDTLGGRSYSIYNYAFYSNTSLESVTISNGVTQIGNHAFYECISLTSITIPSNITYIGAKAFAGCFSLIEICNDSSLSITKSSMDNGEIASHAFNVYSSNSGSSKLHYQTLDDSSIAVYYQDNSIMYLVKINNMKSMVILPDTLGGRSYSIYNYAFYDRTSLTSIIISNGVTSIGSYAFHNCTSLTSVTIGSNITHIYSYAFSGCTSLTSVTIPDSVTKIYYDTFYGCTSLTTIDVSDNNNDYCSVDGILFNKDMTKLVRYPSGKTEQSYTIPNSVIFLERRAFYECESLTSVIIPESVTSIEWGTFESCSSLVSVIIPDSATSINNYGFAYCSSLTTVTIGKNITFISDSAFTYCESLTSVINRSLLNIEKGSSENGNVAFYADTVTGQIFDYSIGAINGHYNEISGIASITGYNGSPTSLVFDKVTIDDDEYEITWIDDSAFSGCTTLTTMIIPRGVITISAGAFRNCASLEMIVIPSSVKSIGSNIFASCPSLKEIIIESNDAWGTIFLCSLNISFCSEDESTIIQSYSPDFDGYAYIRNGSNFIRHSINEIGEEGSSEYVIAVIEDNKLMICGNGEMIDYDNNNYSSRPWNDAIEDISEIVIKEGVRSIGDYAFFDCSSVNSIDIPGSVTSIGSRAFSGCSSLTNITVSNDNNEYDSVDGVLFNKNMTILLQYPAGKTVSSYTIPDGIRHIDWYAFSGCTSLTSVEIPNGVTSIGNYAFNGCYSIKFISIPQTVTSMSDDTFSLGTAEHNALCRANNLSALDLNDYSNEYTEIIYDYLKIDKPTVVTDEYTYDSESKSIVFSGITDKMSVSNNEGTNAGTYDVTVSINDTVLYAWSDGTQDPLTFTLTIDRCPVMITADDVSLKYYDGIPNYTATVTGLLNDDTYEGYTVSCEYIQGTEDQCEISVSGPETYGNYTAEYRSGTLTVSMDFISEPFEFTINSGGTDVTLTKANGTSVAIPDTITANGRTYDIKIIAADSLDIDVTDLTIGSKVTRIDLHLEEFDSLQTITVSTQNSAYASSDGILFNKEMTQLIRYPASKSGTSYTISDYVTSLGEGAFKSCSSLTFIDISTGIRSLPSHAFYGCSSLLSISIPRNVTSINAESFRDCISLETVIIPKNVSYIGNDAFVSCTSLKEIIIESNDDWGTRVSYSFGVTFFSEDGTTTISSSSPDFDGYAYIKDDSSKFIRHSFNDVGKIGSKYVLSILDSDTLTLYGNGEMIGFSTNICPWENSIDSISKIIIKEGVKSIGHSFEGCSSLTNVTIPDSVIYIDGGAFSCCTSLTSVTIGNSVTSIGDYAFLECVHLVEVCNNSNLVITKGSSDHGWIAYYALNVYSSESGNSKLYYQMLDDSSVAVYYQDDSVTCLVNISDMKNTVTLPNTLDGESYRIHDYAFYWCTTLESITISNGVSSIGDYAFDRCRSLTSITIGNSVTSIGDYAFCGCIHLVEVCNNSDLVITKGSLDYGWIAYHALNVYSLSSGSSKLHHQTLDDSSVATYYQDDSVTCLVNISDMKNTVTLPNTLGGESYRIHDYAFYWCTTLESITISNGVTCVGAYSFSGCISLTSETIPDSVINISDYAFSNCTSLTSVTIGNNVTQIGTNAFTDCRSLTSVTIPGSVIDIGDDAFWKCTSLTTINVSENNSNYCSANGVLFNKDRTKLIKYPSGKTDQSYIIPNSVTSIIRYAFYDCYALTTITIGKNVISLEDSAFSDCTSLTSVINNSLLCIVKGSSEYGNIAYYADTVTGEIRGYSIGDIYGAYNDVSKIASVTRYNGSQTSLILDNVIIKGIEYELTWIDDYAFLDCSSLISITIPRSITLIGNGAFYNCSSLENVTIPNSIITIGNNAFASCTSLKEIIIESNDSWESGISDSLGVSFYSEDRTTLISSSSPDFDGYAYINDGSSKFIRHSISEIGEGESEYVIAVIDDDTLMIYGNGEMIDYDISSYGSRPWNDAIGDISEIVIKEGVRSIGDYAFFDCSSMDSIDIPDSVTSIGCRAFSGCTSLTTIYIPDNTSDIHNETFIGCSSLTSIVVSSNNDEYCSVDGVLFNKNMTILLHYPAGKTVSSYTIPDGIRHIDWYAFSGCIALTTISIPDSVSSISGCAFSGCTSLTTIAMPDSVTFISYRLFSGCTSLRSITLSDDITSIIDEAFFGCSSLTTISIPDRVTSIGNYAFSGCTSLTTVSLPNNIKSISNSAFFGCTSLTSIEIPNGVTSIGNYAFNGCYSIKYFSIPQTVTGIGGNAFSLGTAEHSTLCRADNLSALDLNDYSNEYTEIVYDYLRIDKPTAITNEYTYDSESKSIVFSSITDKMTVSDNEGINVGTYNVTVSLNDTALYAWSDGTQNPLTFTLTVNRCPVTITANDVSLMYYDDIPEYTATVTGLLNDDKYEGYTVSCNYVQGTEQKCVISVSGPATYGNYSAEYRSGTLTVSMDFISEPFEFTINSGGADVTLTKAKGTTVEIPDTATANGHIYNISVIAADSIDTAATSIKIGSNVSRIDLKLEKYDSLQTISVSSLNGTYTSSNNVLFSKDMTELIKYLSSKTEITYDIPKSITTIDDYAFIKCKTLVSIIIPSSVTRIGQYVFTECSSLTSIEVSSDNSRYCSKDGILFDKEMTELIQFPMTKEMASYSVPDGITSIGVYAFSGCGLKAVYLPDTVTNIGKDAFKSCHSIEYIKLNGDCKIGENAFALGDKSNKVLCRIDCNETIDLGKYTNEWTSLIYSPIIIDIPAVKTNEYIYDSSVKEITFEGLSDLITVSDNSRTNAGTYNVTVSINNTYIYGWSDGTQEPLTFELVIKEKPITITANDLSLYYYDDVPEYTVSISGLLGDDTYEGYSISSSYTAGSDGTCQITVTGPKTYGNYTAEYISGTLAISREFTFDGCEYRILDDGHSISLIESDKDILTVPDSASRDKYKYDVTSISKDSLPVTLTEIILCASIKDIDTSVFDGCTSLRTITVDSASKYYSSISGVLFDKSAKTLLRCPISYETDSYIIPSTVITLNDGAFSDCCMIEKITIQKDLKSIGEQPFSGCSSLKEISVSEDNRKYNSYDGVLCNDYSIIRCPEGKEGTFSLNEKTTITTVCDQAFMNCTELTDIYLGDSVTSIADGAFKGCSSVNIQAFGVSGKVNTGIDSIESVRAFVTDGKFTYSDGTSVYNISCPSFNVMIGSNKVGIIHISSIGKEVKIEDSILRSYYNNICADSLDLISYISSEEYFDEPKIEDGTVTLEVLGSSFSITFVSGTVTTTLSYGSEGILHDEKPDPYEGAPKGCIASWPEYTLDRSTTQKVNAVFESYIEYSEYSSLNNRTSGTVMVTGLNNNVSKWYSHLGDDFYIDIPNTTLDGKIVIGIKEISDDVLTKINIGSSVHDIVSGAFNKCTALKEISVADNQTYISKNGSLLSDDGTILYAVPYNAGTTYTLPDSVKEIDSQALCGNVRTIVITSARDILLNSNCNATGHDIGISASDNVVKMSIDSISPNNESVTLTSEKKDDPLGSNLGLTGNVIELIVMIVCTILVFIMIVRMGNISVNPEQKNLWIPVAIATIADASMFIYLLLVSLADVNPLFTYLWIAGAAAVIVEVISVYSLYMYQISRDDKDLSSTYKKRGRILTYIGETIGILSAVTIIVSIIVMKVNIDPNINLIVILIAVVYIIVEGLVMSTIYRAFDNTKKRMNSELDLKE